MTSRLVFAFDFCASAYTLFHVTHRHMLSRLLYNVERLSRVLQDAGAALQLSPLVENRCWIHPFSPPPDRPTWLYSCVPPSSRDRARAEIETRSSQDLDRIESSPALISCSPASSSRRGRGRDIVELEIQSSSRCGRARELER